MCFYSGSGLLNKSNVAVVYVPTGIPLKTLWGVEPGAITQCTS